MKLIASKNMQGDWVLATMPDSPGETITSVEVGLALLKLGTGLLDQVLNPAGIKPAVQLATRAERAALAVKP